MPPCEDVIGFFSGISATRHSVVNSIAAMGSDALLQQRESSFLPSFVPPVNMDYSGIIAKTSLSLKTSTSSPSNLTSVPAYFAKRTLSPASTSIEPVARCPGVSRNRPPEPYPFGVFLWRCREARCRFWSSLRVPTV